MTTEVITLNRVPQYVQPWIELSGSMTQAIAGATGAQPSVAVTLSEAGQANLWEVQQLGGQSCFIREIELSAATRPCLQARSLALMGTAPAQALASLGSRPLAELLFQGNWYQGEIFPIRTSIGEFGRAAVWRDDNDQPLLVQEIFNPAFVQSYQPEGAREAS